MVKLLLRGLFLYCRISCIQSDFYSSLSISISIERSCVSDGWSRGTPGRSRDKPPANIPGEARGFNPENVKKDLNSVS